MLTVSPIARKEIRRFACWMLLGACLGSSPAASRVGVELDIVVTDLPVVDVGHAGDGSGRLVLATTDGMLWVVEDGQLANEPWLDLSDRVVCCGESGFAAFAFHPDFPARDELFVLYTRVGPQIAQAKDSVLSRFRLAADDSGRFDPESEVIVLRIPEPASNHNANDLEFGPDGFLYLSTGDGGGQEDAFGNGQNGATLNGKILRLDPDGAVPYAVPTDNPFVDEPEVRDEIWALGLRNPWRIGFDRVLGDLWIADAGQERWEEVNRVPAGASGLNFGWSQTEGDECFVPACDPAAFTPPELAYCHAGVEGCAAVDDCAIAGARRYRGHRAPELIGQVVYVDFCSGRIRAARPRDGGYEITELHDADESFLTLGEDERGELYVTTFDTVYRLRGLPEGFADDFETGTLDAWATTVGASEP